MLVKKPLSWLPIIERRSRRKLLREADAARDRRDWPTAAVFYRRALAISPSRHALRVQLGHMLKESGDFQAADDAYLAVLAITPDDSDLHLQLGHLRKLQGDLPGALRFYRRAVDLDPANDDARHEYQALEAGAPAPEGSHQPDVRPGAPGSIPSLYAMDDSYFTRDVVSFDLFDTLLRRRYIAANEVHDTVSAFVLAQLGRFGVESPGQVTVARYTTTDLLKTSPHVQNEEPSLTEIWTQFIGARIGHTAEAASLAAAAAAFEYDIDAQNLTAIDGAVELLARLKANGKRVIAVSDMYYSAAQIDAILDRAGLLRFFDQVFVSCDIKATKQTGNLFRHVCKSLAVEPADVVHIGDNLRSDIQVPRELGMHAIHIDQPAMLRMERPEYGKRADIHEEVADLIKLFSMRMLFCARSNRADQVYFLTRDGCLMNSALSRWNSPLVRRYLDDIPRAELFLSRATTCWLGTNFQGKWLLQSIGHAFWLHHGQATARQISDIFGIPDTPPTLGERVFRSDTDTFEVLEAYTKAGLAPAIRASLMEKRDRVGRYLRDAGFFARQSVAVCDVGYSGTVVRDLNAWLLQESVRPGHSRPPRIEFHVVASNGNYADNAVRARPHVTFADPVVLPIQQMPQALADSFAWLEVFFKHPTFGPLLGYAEKDGRMAPRFETLPDPGEDHPTARILQHMTPRDSDIALLWMAAIDFWGQFSGPFLDRFAHPDQDTVAQMLDDIYETDAVTGQTRSVVLLTAGMSDDEIYQAAKTKDYWIPGSIAANRHAREMEARNTRATPVAFAPSRRKPGTRLEQFIRSLQLIEWRATGALDTSFYRDFYADLRVLPGAEALKEHYRLHGAKEGRYRSSEHMRRALAAVYGPLPPDFDHTAYLWSNPDLVPHDPPRWHAEMHYLKTGRKDGRSYQPSLDGLDREFEEMAASGSLVLTPEEQAARSGRVPLSQIVFRRHGIGPGPWLDVLDLLEFGALNAAWCEPPRTKAAAVEAFLREGVGRLAPLSLKALFDPAFYRHDAYGAAGLSDVEAYRNWLTDGILLGRSPSEGHRLLGLIGTTEFPACFDWQAFRDRHAEQLPANPSRTDVLDAYLASGDPAEPGILDGPGSATLLEALGQRATWHGRRDAARLAFQAAMDAGGPAGRLWHKLGDLAFDERDFHQAVADYAQGIASPAPDRWSYFKGVMAACEIRAFPQGFNFLDAGIEAWKDMEPWRRAKATLLQTWYDTRYAQLYQGPGSEGAEADRMFAEFMDVFAGKVRAYLPAGLALAHPAGRIVVLTGAILSDRTQAALQARAPSGAGSRAVGVFSRPDLQAFVEGLVGASLAILHQVDCDAEVVQAALTARAYGIRTIFWFGELGDLPAEDLALSDLAWNDFMLQSPAPPARAALPSFYAAALCDRAVSTTAAMLPALASVAPDKSATFVPRPSGPLPARGQGRVAVLVHPPAGVPETAAEVAGTLAALLDSRPELVLLMEAGLPESRLLSRFAARVVTPPRDRPATPIPLEGVVDLVIDLTDGTDPYRSHWAQAAQAGVPCIVTPPGCLPGLADGVDLVVVQPGQALVPAVNRLLDDAGLRSRIGTQARSSFDARYAAARPAPAAQPATRRPRKRILYANVFFPPQSIGGATRVLKDNIDDMLALAADRYEIAVLASDDENSNRGATRCDSYRGIPVFRIATPQEIDMDWRTFNAEVGLFARRVLDLFKPDLVHIHCLQRLSVAFAEACQAGGYPYVVTLHDAWWLSDFPFLLDEEGRVTHPGSSLVDQSFSRRIGFGTSAHRADCLRRALNAAEERLAVSEAFAAIYREAGFQVRTIANGVSPFTPPPRNARRGKERSRVRLGHVGGTQHHKGAYLIEAVLRSNSFDNLHFTVIELARDTGDETRTVWGNTPVTITGKIQSHRIGELYATLDVLLAPSIWPESFGLVTREAAAYGLWIIASGQGAIGDVVVPDQNGFIVDVDTTDSLLSVLRTIDADPGRFTVSPPLSAAMRTSADQGRDLIALYDARFSQS